MQRNYKSHGKHCYLRSFPLKCRGCGEIVLFWECKHGSKLLFEYPPYGKLLRHRCKKKKINKEKYKVIVKTQEKLFDNEIHHCLDCGKYFKTKGALEAHVRSSKKNFGNVVYLDENYELLENEAEEVDDRLAIKKSYKPKFGRIKINIKKRNE